MIPCGSLVPLSCFFPVALLKSFSLGKGIPLCFPGQAIAPPTT